MIAKLSPKYAVETAQIHFSALPEEFLPQFGLKFLIVLHSYLLASDKTIGVGYFQKKVLLGFALASTNTQGLFRETILKGFWQLFPPVVKKLVASPLSIKYCFQTFVYGKLQTNTFPSSELLVIAVDQTARRRGIGNRLVKSLTLLLKQEGLISLSVATVRHNAQSNAFYKHIGAEKSGGFTLYDKEWNLYILRL